MLHAAEELCQHLTYTVFPIEALGQSVLLRSMEELNALTVGVGMIYGCCDGNFLSYLMQNIKMELRIEHTWDGLPVSRDPVTTVLKSYNAGLLMPLSAPFFNDPPGPVGVLGKPLRKLWDYEVVEAFFLSDRAEKDLEVQLCPCVRKGAGTASLRIQCDQNRNKTEGKNSSPLELFNTFSVFAIHGLGEQRKYDALLAVPQHKLREGQKHNFHRLEFFQELNLKEVMGEDWKQPESDILKSQAN
ncbi:hypothetical protein CIB84_007987 [Bambusicola thoracicus]|uniref:Uncharacterized protein n=1 Tax=Bambusicola thoracicus TaxID=9083 RepID=A0A2P4SVZ8_BAMTH|nr:hypothetical protein CIB84_007987 [Bambusicola thoracicus]